MKAKITDKTIKGLRPPEQGNRIVYDHEIRGFGVRITAGKAIAFILEYSIGGRQRRYTIGPWPAWTATAARAEALKLRGNIAKGIDPLAEKAEQRAAPTVAELAERYIEEHAIPHKRPSSVRNDKGMLEKHIKPELGNLKVAAVGRTDIERLHRKLRSHPYQANRVLALLSTVMTKAIEWKLRPDNPCKGIKRYPEEKRETWLQTDAIARLDAALDAHGDRTVANAIRLILLTGARRGEVLKAQWSELDLQRAVWTKPSHHTKQRKTEHVPLNQPAIALLRNLHQQALVASSQGKRNDQEIEVAAQYVFPGKVPGQPVVDIKKSWASIRNAAGLGKVRLHDLRHTFASHLASKGVSLHIVGKLLGHTRSETTMRYAHLADEALREATGQFGALVENAGENRQPAEVITLPRAASSD
ncbi:MAG: tyrosine-type recombinase/integrase [Candidatus Binataceae bacterium]